ncbi:hypothetical protein BKA67DRAFT_555529 [Truncatella angustata]|uniref:Uncharacterized protein n=1 Tax=Truncatella angustata TaxID=152316 RepID=A0A9P8USS4_9PEZI|nr:uncharacterized protein BKA67DRAFT_555529 [Truncatella angustata]KAH6657526.1 hypothetical protein BKA67DRAFT_555529 [Truncatella angustata]
MNGTVACSPTMEIFHLDPDTEAHKSLIDCEIQYDSDHSTAVLSGSNMVHPNVRHSQRDLKGIFMTIAKSHWTPIFITLVLMLGNTIFELMHVANPDKLTMALWYFFMFVYMVLMQWAGVITFPPSR